MIRREHDSRLDKWNVFQEKSTYLNDYRFVSPDERKIYRWPNDRQEKPPKPIPYYDVIDPETYVKWRKQVHIPFNLLWRPRPILETNPKDKIEFPEKMVDKEWEHVLKTRPRVYMGPAVSMDDIPDPEMRELLIKYMYTTDWKRATEEAKQKCIERKVPDKVAEVLGDPIKLDIESVPSLPEGWREKGRPWDKEQARASVDPTKNFWLKKDPPVKCGACDNPVAGLVTKETKNNITNLIEEDRLRIPYDYNKPGYTGYIPRMVGKGLAMEKKDLHFTHPLLSTNQAIQATKTEEVVKLI